VSGRSQTSSQNPRPENTPFWGILSHAKDLGAGGRIAFENMKKLFMVLMVVAGISGISSIAEDQSEKPAAPPKIQLRRFDLDFPGGSPKDLVAELNKPLNGTLNVILPLDSDDVMIPPMRLNNVNVADVFQALGRASQKTVSFRVGRDYQSASEAYLFTTEGVPSESSVWAFRAVRPNIPKLPQDKAYRFYQLGPYLEELKIDDITTAIQTAEKMINMKNPPELKFHPETRLLIAVGSEEGFDLIDDVLRALPRGTPKPPGRSEVNVNGLVDKPGNISMRKDEKLTVLGAIGRAGGCTFADTRELKIRLSRPGRSERVLTFDQLEKENDPAKMIYVEPGDVIDVRNEAR